MAKSFAHNLRAKMPSTFNSLFIFLALAGTNASAQSSNAIEGHVRTVDGVALYGANIVVLGTTLGDVSDEKGYFQINGPPAGHHEIEASLIGYKPAVQTASVKTGLTACIDFYLHPDTLLLDEVTVTARAEEGLSALAPHVEVITSEEISNSNAQNVSELLQQLSGVFIKSYGNAGAQQTISIRGGESNQVLILIDGKPASDPQTGNLNLNNITLTNVERIEVLKGGASALFGNNAVAGVINIQTKAGPVRSETDVSFLQTLADFGTRQLGAQLAQKIARLRYNIGIDWLSSDGDFEFVNTSRQNRPRQIRQNADFRSYNTFVRAQFALTSKTDIDLKTQFYNLKTGTPGAIDNPTPAARSTDRRYLANLSVSKSLWQDAQLHVSAFYNRFDNSFEDPERTILSGNNENQSFGLAAIHTHKFYGRQLITLGFDYKKDDVAGSNIDGHPQRHSSGAFARARLDFPCKANRFFSSIGLYPAIRIDKFSNIPLEFSPKLSVTLRDVATPGLKLVIDAGKSFRVPSFNSLFFISSVQVRSNPDLEPESATEFDFGLHYTAVGSKLGQYRIGSTYFHRSVNGTILWLPDFRFIWSPRNISKVISEGIELSFAWSALNDAARININYTFNSARFDVPGNQQPVPYRPENMLVSELSLKPANFDVSFEHRWISQRYPNVAGTNAIPAYWLLDFTIAKQIEIGSFVFLPKFSVHNVFSEDYAVVNNFPMPGREFRISLVTKL